MCVLTCVCPHLEDVVGTLAAEIVLAGQDDHRLGEHLQADGTDELLLQTLHDAECPGGDGRHPDRTGEEGRRGGRGGRGGRIQNKE